MVHRLLFVDDDLHEHDDSYYKHETSLTKIKGKPAVPSDDCNIIYVVLSAW